MKPLPEFFFKRPELPLWALLRELQVSQEELSKATDGALTRAAIAKWQSGATPLHPVLACYLTELCRLKFKDARRYADFSRLEIEGLLGRPIDDDWFALAKIQFAHIETLLAEQDRLNAAHPEEQAMVKAEYEKSSAKDPEMWAKTDPQRLLREFRRKQGEERQAERTKNQRKAERQKARK